MSVIGILLCILKINKIVCYFLFFFCLFFIILLYIMLIGFFVFFGFDILKKIELF